MKKFFVIPCLVGVVLSCAQLAAQSQEFKEHLSKEYTLGNGASRSTLAIYNINGSIKVEGYVGDKVLLEVDKTISAKDNATLEVGKKEFQLQLDQKGDSILAYITEPFDSRPNRNHLNNHREIKYGYKLVFTVKVPYSMNLHVSTVNDGDVVVKDVSGTLQANNVNGAITLSNAKGATNVHTINGDVDINYLIIPPGESSYYTLNGDIRVSYPANFAADVQFKSFQGEFFTDFPNAEVLPVQAVKNQEQTGSGTVYKLNKHSAVRIGKGGQIFKFETFNGNIYVKKQS